MGIAAASGGSIFHVVMPIADGAERVSSRYTCVSRRQPFQHRALPSYNRAFARIVVRSLQ